MSRNKTYFLRHLSGGNNPYSNEKGWFKNLPVGELRLLWRCSNGIYETTFSGLCVGSLSFYIFAICAWSARSNCNKSRVAAGWKFLDRFLSLSSRIRAAGRFSWNANRQRRRLYHRYLRLFDDVLRRRPTQWPPRSPIYCPSFRSPTHKTLFPSAQAIIELGVAFSNKRFTKKNVLKIPFDHQTKLKFVRHRSMKK